MKTQNQNSEIKTETQNQKPQRRILRHVNIEKLDPEEWAWRKRKAERTGEIW